MTAWPKIRFSIFAIYLAALSAVVSVGPSKAQFTDQEMLAANRISAAVPDSGGGQTQDCDDEGKSHDRNDDHDKDQKHQKDQSDNQDRDRKEHKHGEETTHEDEEDRVKNEKSEQSQKPAEEIASDEISSLETGLETEDSTTLEALPKQPEIIGVQESPPDDPPLVQKDLEQSSSEDTAQSVAPFPDVNLE